MKVVNNFLHLDSGAQCDFIATGNFGKTIKPLYLIIHYTAGTTSKSAVDWFKKPESQASAHLVIDRDGDIVQMVPFNRRAWHAGASKWGELNDLNSYSIGIELVNAGKLKKNAQGKWLNWSKAEIPDDQVTVDVHRNETTPAGWHEYTEAQIETVIAVGLAVAPKYGIVDVLGHDDIAPNRKIDPGPLFPLSSVRSRVLGREW